MNNPIRILHIFGRMDRGGAELRTLDIMRRLDRKDFQCEFCTLSGLPGQLDEEIVGLGGQIHPEPIGWGFGRRFCRLLHHGNFDIVHSHVHHVSGYILRLAHQAGVPGRIAHFRSSRDFKRATWLRRIRRRLLCRWIAEHATTVLSVSQAVMQDAWSIDWANDSKCKVIYNGIDTTAFQVEPDAAEVRQEFGFAADCPLVIHVGNLKAVKNHARLVEAFAALARRHPDACLLMVGKHKGSSESEQIAANVYREVSRQGLNNRVRFAGSRNDVPRLLMSADLMIFPSHWEGLPGALLEACAAGLPVLATNLPVISEVANHYQAITPLSLELPASHWADCAGDLLQRHTGASKRTALRAEFRNGPFGIEKCVAQTCAEWTRAHGSGYRRMERSAA